MVGFLELANGERIPVRDDLLIGRASSCDAVLDDTKASRRHARLIVAGGVVEIEDLHSSNGTLLNGKPVERRMLRFGDEIQIGATVLRYVEDGLTGSGTGGIVRTEPAVAEDVDLFADQPSAPPKASPPSAAPPTVVVAPPRADAPRSEPPVPPAVSPAPPPQVVEFEDEVVVVRKETPPPGRASAPMAGAPTIQKQQRLLQYHKKEAKGGLLGDDLQQMGSGMRALVYLLVLAGAVGLFWLVLQLVG